VRPTLEVLESRLVPYSVSGNAWPSSQLITISFVPDGTVLGSNSSGYIYSNLQATFNAKFGSAAAWQNQILQAANEWAQQTNLNFAFVSDNGANEGSGSYQQGDPNMGDIRIGGYNFNNSYLALANMPPPVNNYSIAGDIEFNTGKCFNITGGLLSYDLRTVALHELGHALGLNHSLSFTAVMFSTYTVPKQALSSDDINGIRNIYSSNNPRSADQFGGTNTSFATAANITSTIDPTALTALLTGLSDNSTPGDADSYYYTFTAPSGTTGTLTVNVQSAGLSLLTPVLTVYAADQHTVLGTASAPGVYGATVSVTVTGVTAGQQFYVKVSGGETTSLGAGEYAMTLNFGSGSSPIVPLPNTQDPNGSPLHAGGGVPDSTASSVESAGRDIFGQVDPDTVKAASATAVPIVLAHPASEAQASTATITNAAAPVVVVSVVVLPALPSPSASRPVDTSSGGIGAELPVPEEPPVPAPVVLLKADQVPATPSVFEDSASAAVPSAASWSVLSAACFVERASEVSRDSALPARADDTAPPSTRGSEMAFGSPADPMALAVVFAVGAQAVPVLASPSDRRKHPLRLRF
jgi:hypothetical protein